MASKLITTAEKYIDDVIERRIPVSEITRLTFLRHRSDIDRQVELGIVFNQRRAERFFAACRFMRHSPDKVRWVEFVPEPWQAAIIYIVFGWEKPDGYRRFNYAYIELPKKNGKTTFAAIIDNYLLFFDGENEAEVYCAATVERQAHICFDKAKLMVEKSPSLAARAKCLTNNVSVASTGSKMEPLGRDSKAMEGINPSGSTIDEYHVFSWKNNEVFENIQSASVNRRQPLHLIITTAGRDKDLPCFEYHNLINDINRGIKKQEDTFGVIYTIDDGDDWRDPSVWPKANPNWGVSVLPDRFEGEFNGALNSRSKEVSFKTKNLNIWCDAPDMWISDDKFMESSITDDWVGIRELKDMECYGGLDLASHIDTNALALFFPGKERSYLLLWYWIPESKAKAAEDDVDYKIWIRDGFMKSTPGEIVDIDGMTEDIGEILREYNVVGLAYDPWHAHHGVIQNLIKGGYTVDRLDPYQQSLRNMSAPTKEMESLIMAGKLEHFKNPVLRWNLRNTVMRRDANDNMAPDKRASKKKIDGVVASIMAIGEYLTLANSDDVAYRDHSLRFV